MPSFNRATPAQLKLDHFSLRSEAKFFPRLVQRSGTWSTEPWHPANPPVPSSPRHPKRCLGHPARLGRPGVIAQVRYPLDNGQTVTAHLLIDGNHRAARSLRDGVPFFAYLLTEDETAQTLLRSPQTVSVRPSRSKSRAKR
jgi:hypothetical protein